MAGATIGCCPFAAAVRVRFEAEFGCDDDFVPEGSESFADQFFVDVWAVDFGCIEEGNAALNGGSNKLDGF
jgi:hypothetical protein